MYSAHPQVAIRYRLPIGAQGQALSIAQSTFKLWRASHDWLPSFAINPRFRSTWASYRPADNLVSIHSELFDEPPSIIREVLIHELAHCVAYKRSGLEIRPHGAEWQSLMTEAGLVPRRRIHHRNEQALGIRCNRPKVTYRHYCPICHFERFSRVPQRRWRCAACTNAGLDGRLSIETCLSQSKKD
jgi:predicted SprT family Zn-dependent metalloprotease